MPKTSKPLKTKNQSSQSTGLSEFIRLPRKEYWLVAPLALMTFLCGYSLVYFWPDLSYVRPDNFVERMYLAFFAFVIGLFSGLYVYYDLRKRPMLLPAKIVAYLLGASLGLFTVVLFLMSFGSNADPALLLAAYYFVFINCLFNPYVGTIVSILSIVGIISLVIGNSNRKK